MMYSSGNLNKLIQNINVLKKYRSTLFFRDSGGYQTWYEAIAVIEYKGTLSNIGQSSGHYMCDIKGKVANSWFRTNDNCNSFPVPVLDVSKYGYAVLYKRV